MVSLPAEHRRSCHLNPSAGVGRIAISTAAIIIIIIIIIIVIIIVVVVVNIRGREAGALRSITLSRVVNAEVRVCLCLCPCVSVGVSVSVCVSVCVRMCLCLCVRADVTPTSCRPLQLAGCPGPNAAERGDVWHVPPHAPLL